jgi:hypothetical protein
MMDVIKNAGIPKVMANRKAQRQPTRMQSMSTEGVLRRRIFDL